MRLICPNCDAEYEVDASAIPEGGRDVQCSACGHAWFQLPPEVIAAEEDEAELYDAPPLPPGATAAATPTPPEAAPEPVTVPGSGTGPRPAAGAAQPAPGPARPEDLPLRGRSLDESLLAVLREEAERETAARKLEAALIETQTEMPLAPMATPPGAPVAAPTSADAMAPAPSAPAASPAPSAPSAPSAPAAQPGPALSALRKIARLRGQPEPRPPAPTSAEPARPRRELLPEIDLINSTLRSAGERRDIDDGAVAETLAGARAGSGGFRRGFVTVMALAILGAALYAAAPVLAARVPALADAMAAYVSAVDMSRLALDGLARTLTVKLMGLAGGGQG